MCVCSSGPHCREFIEVSSCEFFCPFAHSLRYSVPKSNPVFRQNLIFCRNLCIAVLDFELKNVCNFCGKIDEMASEISCRWLLLPPIALKSSDKMDMLRDEKKLWLSCVMTQGHHHIYVKNSYFHFVRPIHPFEAHNALNMDKLRENWHGRIDDAAASWGHNDVKPMLVDFPMLSRLKIGKTN